MIKLPGLAALLCCLSLLLSASTARAACAACLFRCIDFYSVIYSEQGFCLLCVCNAPHMHYYRNNLIQSAWDFKHPVFHSQNIWPRNKPPVFVLPLLDPYAQELLAVPGAAGSPLFPSSHPGSFTILCCLVDACMKLLALPRALSVSCITGCELGIDEKLRQCTAPQRGCGLTPGKVVDAGFTVFPVVSSSPTHLFSFSRHSPLPPNCASVTGLRIFLEIV